MSESTSTIAITGEVIAEESRMQFATAMFKSPFSFPKLEGIVFSQTSKFCAKYKGGYWEYVSLSNGGFYMYPRIGDVGEKFDVCNADNYGESVITADALGIVVTLIALSHLSFALNGSDLEKVCDLHALLMDYYCEHAESEAIAVLID